MKKIFILLFPLAVLSPAFSDGLLSGVDLSRSRDELIWEISSLVADGYIDEYGIKEETIRVTEKTMVLDNPDLLTGYIDDPMLGTNIAAFAFLDLVPLIEDYGYDKSTINIIVALANHNVKYFMNGIYMATALTHEKYGFLKLSE